MARVDVNPNILQWAAERSGTSEIIEKRFPHWLKWIKNESQPTLKQLEKVAKATATPLGYFFLQKPPIERLPIPHFRTVNDHQTDNPSPNLLETVQLMERRQERLREYYIDNRYDPLSFVGSKNIDHNPEDIAKEIKEALGLKHGWASQCRTWEDALRMAG